MTSCSSDQPATCSPTGSTLILTASGNRSDKACLAAPANEPFTVDFENKDAATDHNFLVSVGLTVRSDVNFDGDIVAGPGTAVYQVATLAPGSYSFECKIHPGSMHGTFVVAAPASSSGTA